MAKTAVKQITFPEQLLKFLEQKSKEYGYSLPAYVRYVLTKEMEKEFEKQNSIEIDEDFIKGLKEGMKESEEGVLQTLRSRKEIRDYFTALADAEE
jgi:FMN phosphatase YigB (HAD superfamily)